MPVEFDEYNEDKGRIDIAPGTNAREILSFLLDHPGIGFTPAEIHEETGIPRGSIGPTLKRLNDAGLIRHKGDYWAVEKDDRLAAVSAAMLGRDLVLDKYTDDWYADNPGWADDLADLSEDSEEE